MHIGDILVAALKIEYTAWMRARREGDLAHIKDRKLAAVMGVKAVEL
jgi:hypothetical protein